MFDPTTLFRLSVMVGIVAILATVTVGAASADDKGKKKEPLTEVVYVCVNVQSGHMRAVNSDTVCKNKELPVSWGSNGVGPVGPEGPQGPQGETGPEGPVGPAGADGAAGQDGADGAAGIDGINGLDGLDGVDGTDGVDGINGLDGAEGSQGLPGADGSDGAVGPQGLAGADGQDGADGADGAIGPQGLPGVDGADGSDGAQGPAGADGADGQVGAQGPAGDEGPQGIAGAVGPPGPQGETGPAGPTGPAGSDGADGAAGASGPQGPAGAEGPQGPQGDSGVSNLINFSCPVGEVVIGFDGSGDPVCVAFADLLDNPPVLAAISSQAVLETDTESVAISATDIDGDNVTFTLDSAHSFVSISDTDLTDNQASLDINPVHGDAGNYTVTIRATSGSKSDTFSLSVEVVADAYPTVTAIGLSGFDENPVTVTFTTADSNGHTVGLTLDSTPAWLTNLAQTGPNTWELTGNAPDNSAGNHPISVDATANLLVTQAPFTLVLGDRPDTAPVIATMLETYEVTEATVVDIPLSATDTDGDEITFTVHPSFGLASWMELIDGGVGDDTAILRVSPQLGDAVVDYHVSFLATAHGLEDSVAFDVDVVESVVIDSSPEIDAISDRLILETLTTIIDITARDTDNDSMVLSMLSGPSWATVIDGGTGDGTGTLELSPPAGEPAGPHSVTIRVTANGQTADGSLYISVTDVAVFDDFNAANTTLPGHLPVVNVNGTPWIKVKGDWRVVDNHLEEVVRLWDGDKRLIVDAGVSNFDISADITWNQGVTGLVVRYEDESSWVQTWYDSVQHLVNIAYWNGTTFTILAASPYDWIAGEEHHWDVVQNGDNIRIFIDSVQILNVNSTALLDSTRYGVFDFAGAFVSPGTTGNYLDDFTVH